MIELLIVFSPLATVLTIIGLLAIGADFSPEE